MMCINWIVSLNNMKNSQFWQLAYVAICVCWLALLGGVNAADQAGEDDTTLVSEFSKAGADTCLSCHNSDSMLAIFQTAHGQQADPDAPMAHLQCEACHGPGGNHAGRRSTRVGHTPVVDFGADANSPVNDQDAVCMDCHQSDVHLAWAGSVHERNDTGCAGCHSIHSTTDPALVRAEQNEMCFDCHMQQRADSRKPSAHPIDSSHPVKPATMACTDCHNPHASVSSGQLTRNTTNELCLSCHAEFRGPVLFDHAPVSEDCTLCHQPHGSIHPALLTRRPPLLCQSCHSQNGHPSISFTDASLPGGNPSAMVLGRSCMNCHTQVHGSNHPSGYNLMR
jgi:DmsE family decaheme c-type cytochrome